jgi:hypothetical protein
MMSILDHEEGTRQLQVPVCVRTAPDRTRRELAEYRLLLQQLAGGLQHMQKPRRRQEYSGISLDTPEKTPQSPALNGHIGTISRVSGVVDTCANE